MKHAPRRHNQKYQPYAVVVVCETCRQDIGWIMALRGPRVSIRSVVDEHESMTEHPVRKARR